MRYWTVVYYSVLMYLVNSTVPATLDGIIFSQVVSLVSVLINTNIFSTITVLVGELYKKDVKYQQEIDTAATAMSNLKLPLSDQICIKDYMLFTFNTRDEPEELQDFLSNLSFSYKQRVQVHVLKQVLHDNSVIS